MAIDRATKGGVPPRDNVTETVRRPALAAIPITRFGKYNLIGKLGHGGMAEVFLAYIAGPAGFRKLVVVKRLHDHLLEEPGFLGMFLDEARLAARLNHPNVVQTQEVGEFDGQFFLAMEFLEGQPLDRVRKRCARNDIFSPPRVIAKMIAEALEGLSYAHRLTDYDGSPLNVIHRDVSPHNVFVTYNGMVKLLDFGIAKATTHVSETQAGVVKGKYAYIAPEQGRGYPIDQRADLWSMGVVLWESIANRRLFKGPNDMATLNAALMGPIPSLAEVGVQIPDPLVRICDKALFRDPGRRYQTAQEMKEDIEAYLAQESRPTTRKEVSAFVTNLFADVIEQHRSLLEACLSRSASNDMACDDLLSGREGTPSGVRLAYPLGSSIQTPSDVSAPGSLPGGTGVTPSSSGASHRPQALGVMGAAEPQTASSASARPPGWGEGLPRPAPSKVAPVQPPVRPAALGAPGTTDPAPIAAPMPEPEPVTGSGAVPLVAPAPDPSPELFPGFAGPITGVSPLATPRPRGKGINRLLVVLGVLFAASLSTCVIVLALFPATGGGSADLGAEVAPEAEGQGATPPEPVASEPVPATAPGAGDVAAVEESDTLTPVVEPPEPLSAEADPGPGDVQPAIEEQPGAVERPQVRPPRSTPRVRPHVARPDPRPDPAEATKVGAAPSPRNPAAEPSAPIEPTPRPPPSGEDAEFGFLSLDTVPWSRVSMDGRVLGNTPLLRVRVPAGIHILSLHNPEANITTTYRVTIRSGETTARRLGLE